MKIVSLVELKKHDSDSEELELFMEFDESPKMCLAVTFNKSEKMQGLYITQNDKLSNFL